MCILPLEVYKGIFFDRLRAMGRESWIQHLDVENVTKAAVALRQAHIDGELDSAVLDAIEHCWIQ